MEIFIYLRHSLPEHFWHFMMGEFMPVVSIITETKATKVYLYNKYRKWNSPFDRFYLELGVEIVYTNTLEEDIKKYRYTAWDYKWASRGIKKCERAINYLKTLIAKKKYPAPIPRPNYDKEVLVVYRKNDKELEKYFRRNFGGIKSRYGTKRRRYKDMEKLDEIIPNVNYVSTDQLPILEQINCFLNYKNILLEHGAAMFFVLFMRDNSNVIELINPFKAKAKSKADQSLKRICEHKKNRLERIIIENKKSVLSHKEEIMEISQSLFSQN